MALEKKRNKKGWILVALLILILGAGYVFFKNSNAEEKSSPPQSTEIAEETFILGRESVPREMEFFGSLESKKETDLSAKTSGRIIDIKVKEGDVVKDGQLIASLLPDQNAIVFDQKYDDVQNYEDYRDEEEEYWDKQVDVAKKSLEEKKKEEEYAEKYEPAKVDIAKKEVQKAEALLRSSKRERDSQYAYLDQQQDYKEGDLDLAAQNVDDTRIYSPYDGIVMKKYLEKGTVVAEGEPIVSVADVSAYKVLVDVPDVYVNSLSLGLAGRASFDGIPGDYSAKITNIYPKMDLSSKKSQVELYLDAIPPNAKAGMFARVHIAMNERSTYFVPNNFVYSGYDGPYVIGEDDHKQLVGRLSENGGKTEIIYDGIKDGVKIKRNPNGYAQ